MRHRNVPISEFACLLWSSELLPLMTIRGPNIVIYSYNKSQRDTVFLNFILVRNCIFWTVLLSIIRSLNTVLTATGICRTRYVACLLAATSCWEYSINPLDLKLDIYNLAHHLCKM